MVRHTPLFLNDDGTNLIFKAPTIGNPTFQGDKTQYTMAQGKCLVLSISCRLSRYKWTASDKPWRLHATFDRAPTLQFSISFYKENQKVIIVNVFDTKTATVAKRFVKLYILNLTFRKMFEEKSQIVTSVPRPRPSFCRSFVISLELLHYPRTSREECHVLRNSTLVV